MQRVVVGALFFCGIISIVLQAVGLFSPAWVIYSIGWDTDDASSGADKLGDIFNMGIEVRMGLWTESICVRIASETTCSPENFEENLRYNPGEYLYILCKINLAIVIVCVRFTTPGFNGQITASRCADHWRRNSR